jgi:hypothetical protein
VYFGCSGAVGIAITSNLACGGIGYGSAGILATPKELACTAFIADVSNDPATSMVYLTSIAKTEQKAANQPAATSRAPLVHPRGYGQREIKPRHYPFGQRVVLRAAAV